MAGKAVMHAVQYDSYGGGVAGLKHVEVPVPTPNKDEVLLKVEAASINPIDWKLQKGMLRPFLPRKFPFIPASDVAGEVIGLGSEVKNFIVGDKVVAVLSGGGLAEFAVAKESLTVARPQEVSAAEGAGIPCAGLTAHQALTQSLGVKLDGSGQQKNILITAASGAVGLYAVQLAKLGNTHVTATCGARNIELVRSLGADEVLDYKTPDGAALKSPSGRKYDAVINCVTGIPWSTFEPNLGTTGKVIDLNPSPSVLLTFAWKKLTFSKKQLVPFSVSPKGENLDFLVKLVKEGKLKTVIDSKHSLRKAEDAWAKSISGRATGPIYCKPVELYNILQRRAIRNPSFLQRCLSYQIHEKHNRRIQMTISLSETVNEGLQARFPFPLYILLGRLVSGTTVSEYSAVYRFSRACILTNFTGVEGSTQVQANFVLPEISRLQLKAKSCTLAILLVNFAGSPNSSSGTDLTKARLANDGGYCHWGKIPLESLYRSWEKSPNLSLGQRAELTYPVDMHSGFLKLSCLDKDKCVSIQMPFNSGSSSTSQQVHVTISAEEIGGRDKSPYNSYTCSDISSPSLSRIIRLRAGNVVFNYRYYNNKLQRTEVTEDFSCPFCLAKCASFKGLRYHLSSSHDLFNFEFWVTEEYQAVNVSVKTDIWRSEVVADGVDPKQQTFFFCSKQRRHRRLKNLLQQSKHVHPLVLKPPGVCELLDKADGANDYRNSIIAVAESAQHVPSSFNVAGASNADAQLYTDPEYQLLSGNNLAAPAMLQFAKTRKLSIERSDSRNRTLLQKRQFFHSHRAQPMAWEQVVSDRDSEDEVDDDVADLEDRRMLDDFVDVTKDEKQMMHMWNSFVRKQRVLADGHIPWACEAFTKLYGHDLVQAPALKWCWRLFMIKLWNHGLLDARTMNNCNIILEHQKNDSDPMQS